MIIDERKRFDPGWPSQHCGPSALIALSCLYAELLPITIQDRPIEMWRIISGLFSRIASKLEEHAVQHPTHFPAMSSADVVQKGKAGDDQEEGRQGAENKNEMNP